MAIQHPPVASLTSNLLSLALAGLVPRSKTVIRTPDSFQENVSSEKRHRSARTWKHKMHGWVIKTEQAGGRAGAQHCQYGFNGRVDDTAYYVSAHNVEPTAYCKTRTVGRRMWHSLSVTSTGIGRQERRKPSEGLSALEALETVHANRDTLIARDCLPESVRAPTSLPNL